MQHTSDSFEVAVPRPSLTRFDVFMIVNLLVLTGATLWALFVTNEEFGVYAVIVIVLTPLLWKKLRLIKFPVWMLVLMESMLILHFAGGFIAWDGHSLYGHQYFGIGFDKYVHTYNGLVGALAIATLLRHSKLELRGFEGFLVVMVVAALGSFVEIAEFLVAINVPENGVGEHANTIGDLIANTAGAYAGYLIWSRLLNHRPVTATAPHGGIARRIRMQ